MIIRLTAKQKNAMIEETKKNYPNEACGLLLGKMNSERAIVKRIDAIRNNAESPLRFQFDMEQFINSLSEGEKKGMNMIGFYHSHPSASQPSIIDINSMRLWPETIWLIISSINHTLAAYQMLNHNLKNVQVEILQ